MKVTTTKKVTTEVELEIPVPAYRKLTRKYSEAVELFAIINENGKDVAVNAYEVDGLIIVSKSDSPNENFLEDFTNGQEISEEEFFTTYNSIKAKL